MKFVFPTIKYKNKAISYINEFYEYNSEINGSGALDRYLKEFSYEEWLKKIINDIDIANTKPGRVSGLTYFYVDDNNEIVGMINIRLELNDFLKKEGGNIGYSIRPSKRRNHYATNMLKEALKICKRMRMNEVLISCDKSNPASRGVILNNGGVLQNEFYSEEYKEIIQMYAIKQEH